jgi:hypothetical protein
MDLRNTRDFCLGRIFFRRRNNMAAVQKCSLALDLVETMDESLGLST